MQDDSAPPLTENTKEIGGSLDSTGVQKPSLFSQLRLPQLPRGPRIMLTILLGAVLGLYFQPAPVRMIFSLTGLEPGAGSSAPFAVPVSIPISASAASNPALSVVTALGRLIPQGEVMTLSPPLGAEDSQLARLLVTEGETVAKGQLIAELTEGQIRAPQASHILALHGHVGESIGAAGIAQLGVTNRMDAELVVYLNDVAHVAEGQAVTLASPSLPEPLTGTVTRIGVQVERLTLLTSNPAASTNVRVVRVAVALDRVSSARAAALTGFKVAGLIEIGAAP